MSKRRKLETADQVLRSCSSAVDRQLGVMKAEELGTVMSNQATESLRVVRRKDIDHTRALPDLKHYRLVTFDNGMEALLISDPRISAAASLGELEIMGMDGAAPADGKVVEEDFMSGSSAGSDVDDGGSQDGSCSGSGSEDESGSVSGSSQAELEGQPQQEDDEDSVRSGVATLGDSVHPATHHQRDMDGGLPGDAGGLRLAAAAMAVGVGSLSDPWEVQGLAHYLEHMLFMGSKKYESENEYDSFVSTHGGYSNACTECEWTVYHFEIPPPHFMQALDIFAQFFISPLMKPDASMRELQSIESEFNLSISNDTCRLQQLIAHTCRSDHPYHKFTWGNLASLRDEVQKAGVDIGQELRRFHDQYYVASNMKLVICSMEDLDTLEAIVARTFSDVARGNAPDTSLASLPPPLDGDSCLGSIFRVVPCKDIHQLHVTWPVPSQLPHYRSKPWDYVGHLVGHEGAGSILAELKNRAWATGIVAGISDGGYESSTCCSLFTITVTLTLQGVEYWQSIINLIYQYIDLMRSSGNQRWIFDELQSISEMQFRFQEEVDPGELVEQLATALLPMYHYNDMVLQGPFLLWDWRPDLIDDIMACLTPANARIDLISSSFGRAGALDHPEEAAKAEAKGVPTGAVMTAENGVSGSFADHDDMQKEPRFGTHYRRERLSAEQLREWAGPHERHPKLALPQPNPFLAKNLEVKPLESQDVAAGATSGLGKEVDAALDALQAKHPEVGPVLSFIRATPAVTLPGLVIEEPGLKLWHKQDNVFRMPRTGVFFKIVTPRAYESARHEVLTELLVRLVKDSLNEITYQASVAELNYSFKASELGMDMQFQGLSDKLLELVRLVLGRLLDFKPHLRPDRFKTQKEALVRYYANDNLKPGRYVRNLRLAVLKERMWLADDLWREAGEVTVQELQEFIPQLLRQLHVDCLMHGNCVSSDASALADLVRDALTAAHVEPLPDVNYPQNRVVRLAEGSNLVLTVESKDVGERNSALEAYWQLGEDNIDDRVCVQMLEHIMEEPLYDSLRTKEQLGYVVSCGVRMTHGVLGFCVRLQSERYEPQVLHTRVEEFLRRFRERLASMSDKEYHEQLTALAQNKLQRDPSLNDEAARYWAEVIERRYEFDVIAREVAALLWVTKERVLELVDRFVSVTSPAAKHLCVQVVGRASRARIMAEGVESSEPRHHHDHHQHRHKDATAEHVNGGGAHPQRHADAMAAETPAASTSSPSSSPSKRNRGHVASEETSASSPNRTHRHHHHHHHIDSPKRLPSSKVRPLVHMATTTDARDGRQEQEAFFPCLV